MQNGLDFKFNSVENYDTLFYDRFENAEYLTGDKEPSKPQHLRLDNDELAKQMLGRHLANKSAIQLHTDVDLDGVGACKVMTEWLRQVQHHQNISFYINQSRTHGIQQEHISYFNDLSRQYGSQNIFVIILDSSSNEVELIKQLECDALIIDHHKMGVDKEQLAGETKSGQYIILNYLSNKESAESESLSAGMETFEFLRWVDESTTGQKSLLETYAIYQWGVATLFSDHMDNTKLRNIYWINKSQTSLYKEPSLQVMMTQLGRNDLYISKSNIGYSLAPAFNRAIRAGASGEALYYAINDPNHIGNLLRFKQYQNDIIASYESGAYEFPKYMVKDLTGPEVYYNYAGLMATKLLDKYSKTSIVYHEENGYYVGSFRGKSDTVDYCELISKLGFFAQGHPSAFGFRIPVQYIKAVMDYVVQYETIEEVPYLTYGNVSQAKHKITSLADFREKGLLWRLGILNSYLTTDVNIVAPSYLLAYVRSNSAGTCFIYQVEDLEFVAFEEITSNECYLYIESQDRLKLYVKNKWR